MIATQEPPQTAAVQYAGEGVVVCLMNIVLPHFEHIFPPRNRIALILLCSALAEAALADGQRAEGGPIPINELNNGFVIGIYGQPAPAAECWLAALKCRRLEGFAHLAWKDRSSGWHKVWPKNSPVDFEALIAPEMFQFASAQADAAAKRLEIVVQLLRHEAADKALGNQS